MKTIALLLMLLPAARKAHAGESLLYAMRGVADTKIFSCSMEPLRCEGKFSDSATGMRLMRRSGAMDSVNVIKAAGGKIFAVGSSASSPAGALYELYLDASNRFRKIRDVEGGAPVGRIAAHPKGDRIAYPVLAPDAGFAGEGSSFIVEKISIVGAGGEVLDGISTTTQIKDSLIAYLGWGSDGALHVRVEGSPRRAGLFRITKGGAFEKLPIKLGVLDRLFGEGPHAEWFVDRGDPMPPRFVALDGAGKTIREHPIQGKRGWHCALSESARAVACQTTDNEIWVKDLETGKETSVFKRKLDYFKEALSLIGWTS